MNKKEAVAYAQVTLNHMQSSRYDGEINPETLGIEMKQCIKEYPHNIILAVAESQILALRKLKGIKSINDENY